MNTLQQIMNTLQQNEQWDKDRRGNWTGSNFKKLKGKGKTKDAVFSDTGMTYIRMKVAERFGSYEEEARGKALDWGNKYEPVAIQAYEFKRSTLVEPVGFVLHDKYNFMGSSADGIIECGTDGRGGIEVKCPHNPSNHIRYATDEKYLLKEHGEQIYGNMEVLNLDFMDFISFDPRSYHDLFIQRFYKDAERQALIVERVLLAEELAVNMIEDIENQFKAI